MKAMHQERGSTIADLTDEDIPREAGGLRQQRSPATTQLMKVVLYSFNGRTSVLGRTSRRRLATGREQL